MAPRVERKLAAILAADVVGYSRLVAADEAGTIGRLKALRTELIEPVIAEHHGRVVKLMGDGVLVEFASAVDAVECAVAIQTGTRKREAGMPEARRIAFRIGINIGDIIVEDGGSEKLVSTLATVRKVAWTGAALFGALALLVALSLIRVRFEREERELAVAHLLGASPTFLFVPTTFAGAVSGAFAALFVLAGLYLGVSLYGDAIAAGLHGALGPVSVTFPALS